MLIPLGPASDPLGCPSIGHPCIPRIYFRMTDPLYRLRSDLSPPLGAYSILLGSSHPLAALHIDGILSAAWRLDGKSPMCLAISFDW